MKVLPNDELLGGVVAVAIYVLCILVFVARLAERPAHAYWLGICLLLTLVPLAYLIVRAPQLERPPLFYIQVGLMILYLSVELVLDYWPGIEFRQLRWAVISYVTLFLGATGGMIGVAALAGRGWGVLAVILFWVMTLLAFFQRFITGT